MNDTAVNVNGERRALTGVPAHTTALDWLRESGLPGSKEGCAEGECGACAMLIATPSTDGGTAWTPVNACLIPVYALDGQEVVTAEGLGSPEDLHPVQEKLAEAGGSQCGYCTPGFACSMAGEYYRADRESQATSVLAGGEGSDTAGSETVPAADCPAHGAGAGTGTSTAAETSTAAADPNAPQADIGATSPGSHAENDAHDPEHGPNGFDLHSLSGNLCRCTGYRPIRDAAYALGSPEADDPLQQRLAEPAPAPVPTKVEIDGARFIRPATLDEALGLLRDEPDALLVAGSTDWGVEVNIRGSRAPLIVAIEQLEELRTLDIADDHIEIGAGLSLSEVERTLDGRVPLLAELFPQFASRLIRNRGTFGGNLGTGSPIGDTPPALLALSAKLVLASASGEREVELSEYFTGYRQTIRSKDELIKAVRIPLPLAKLTAFHKIAKRRFDDISSVAVGFALDVEDGIVTSARIGLGGVAATPLRATAAEQALIGQPWNLDTVRVAAAALGNEGTPMSDHRASSAYRSFMLNNAILKLYNSTTSTDSKEAAA